MALPPHLTTSQRGIAAGKARDYYDEEAKKRMSEGGKKSAPGRPVEKKGVALPPHLSRNPKTREKVGKMFGVGGAGSQAVKPNPKNISSEMKIFFEADFCASRKSNLQYIAATGRITAI